MYFEHKSPTVSSFHTECLIVKLLAFFFLLYSFVVIIGIVLIFRTASNLGGVYVLRLIWIFI